jgi:hypothetical protein
VAAIHLRFIWASCEGTVTATASPLSKAIGAASSSACGAAYPWTVEAVESAQQLAEVLDMLEPERTG